MQKLLFSVLFLLYASFCSAEDPLILPIVGHQSTDALRHVKEYLDGYQGDEIILKLDSESGELMPSLALAEQLHALKVSRGAKITVYIENRLLGPAAIFPFLADAWEGTHHFVWGDITRGKNGGSLPQDLLTARVSALITENAPNAALLKMLARSMVDPRVELKRKDKWKLSSVATPKSPQVVNRTQLTDMGFVIETLIPSNFTQKYGVAQVGMFPTEYSPLFSEQELVDHIRYSPKGENLVGFLEIPRDRPIDQSTYLEVKFALEEYREKGVRFVLLRLNTPGGEVFPAMKISDLLVELDSQYNIPVVALVNNWALSAGAMIAYSCRFIVVTKNGLMGAAEPVMAGSDGKMETAPEKMISALRAEFGSLAKHFGRNPLIAQAMVDKDMILVQREGKIIQLNDANQLKSTGGDADVLITSGGKLLTLDAEEMIKYDVADFMIPISATRRVSEAAMEQGSWPSSQSQLFSYPFFDDIPDATIIYYHDWRIAFFSFLTHPLIASLLMMGLIIGIYMELSTPGFGVPGVIALSCLGLILLSNFAIEAINWLEILFVVLGVLLVLSEIFLLPGFGLLGILGIILILLGIFAMLLPGFENIPFSWDPHDWNLKMFDFFEKISYDVGALILSLLCIVLLARFVTPRLMQKSKLVLHTDQEGSVAGPEAKTLPIVGSAGEAFTSLSPGGKVMIENRLYDGLTEGNFIEQGAKVTVIKIRGSAIIVEKTV